MKKIDVKRKSTAPRNPYVAAARFKKAGAHRKTTKALRRADKMDIQGCSSNGQSKKFLISRLRVQLSPPLPSPSFSLDTEFLQKRLHVSVDVLRHRFTGD